MGKSTLISTTTASNAASVEITSGIDSTYDEYMFVFTNLNPVTDAADFTFQVNAAGASGYNETITSTFWEAEHGEGDAPAAVLYQPSYDQAQGTAYQAITIAGGNGGDESYSGILHLFSPSNTTFVKHFYSRISGLEYNSQAHNVFAGGYINTTTAIDEISFKMSGGNFDGVIQMFGIS